MPPTQSSHKVFEILVSLNKPATGSYEILKSVFANFGFSNEETIEQTIDGRKALAVYCASQQKAKRFQRKLKELDLKSLHVTSTILYQDEWLTRWKKDWKPFALTSRIDVVPVWCRNQYRAGRRKYILLDTVSSFGTGLHETTKFMAEFIQELEGRFERLLDIGTGTGILALVALKCGVKEVTAIDIDDMCVDASQANFKANDHSFVGVILHSDLAAFKPTQSFDFVCANLVTHDLITMKRKIFSFVKPGGWLAVSGISLENLPQLRKAFACLPLRCVKIKKGKSWTAVLFKRTKSHA
jgi:ribosomal protein L11 methyltransferase